MAKSLQGTKTHQNLKEAFAGESQANRRYLYFAKVADVEGYPEIAGNFKETADGETGHAHGHLDYLKQVGDPAMGGSTRAPIMTAYRQQALACPSALSRGPRRVRELRPEIPDAQKILLHNVYGWFDRAERGVYVLTDAGHAALKRWPQTPVDFAGAGDSIP